MGRLLRRGGSVRLETVLVGALALALLATGCPKDGPPPQTGPVAGEDDQPPPEAALTPEQMEEVQRTVRGGMTAITRCYSDELEKRNDKSFVGKVVVRILIGTNERATKVEVTETTLKAPAVEQCVVKELQSLDFPKLPKAGWFTYPFAFSPAY